MELLVRNLDKSPQRNDTSREKTSRTRKPSTEILNINESSLEM
jgi:hypothetical protein